MTYRLLGSTKVFLRDVLSGGKTNTDVNKNLTGKAGEQLAVSVHACACNQLDRWYYKR